MYGNWDTIASSSSTLGEAPEAAGHHKDNHFIPTPLITPVYHRSPCPALLTEAPEPETCPRSLMTFANLPPMFPPAQRRRSNPNHIWNAPCLSSIAEESASSFLPGNDVPLGEKIAAAAAATSAPEAETETETQPSRPSSLLKRDCRHEAHFHPSETQHASPESSASDKYFPIRLLTDQERHDAVRSRRSRSSATLNGWYTDLLLLKKKKKTKEKTKRGKPPAVLGIRHFGATISRLPLSEAQAASLGLPELREAAATPFLQALRRNLRHRGRARPLPAPVSHRPSTEPAPAVYGREDEDEQDEVSSGRPLFQAKTYSKNNGTPKRERTSRFIEHLDDSCCAASCFPDTRPLKDALDALLFADKKPAVRFRQWARKVGHMRSIRRLKASA
ncbi:hypothetical protein N3K66_002930 [Trichothecium roseum]|uniref:Uncharacterized protein n=1 Tax=Trichothecium roseum TaxID=47278 RepID=A0ACC0V486_9HYPO|nr:hypothetical protein N3K66_002930 [Trichothecium roseum]